MHKLMENHIIYVPGKQKKMVKSKIIALFDNWHYYLNYSKNSCNKNRIFLTDWYKTLKFYERTTENNINR